MPWKQVEKTDLSRKKQLVPSHKGEKYIKNKQMKEWITDVLQ